MADANGPIKYMDRTRQYYRALGYAQDYAWATSVNQPYTGASRSHACCVLPILDLKT